uniref:ATP-binding domain-containing protein n=1 Tax=Streptomyces rhizosphaericus TaxID=114699 RepID=UPI001FCA3CF0
GGRDHDRRVVLQPLRLQAAQRHHPVAQARQWLNGLGDRVVALGSLEAKGLEYDATVVVSPAEIADESPAGLRVLYVALTRATQRLTVVSGDRDEPDGNAVPDLLRD